MDPKAWIGIGTGAIALVGALFAFDARYLHAEEASKIFSQAQVEDQRDNLEWRIADAELELEFLTKDPAPDENSERRMEYLKARIEMLEKRLLELEER